MSMPDMLALTTALALGLSVADAADAPRFGQPITPADLAPWDISIAPDGIGLPPGSGPLNSTDRDPVKLIGNYWPYATTIFDYTRRAMPWQQPKTLTDDEAYALTAYILALNKIIGENDVMNAETLPKVKMPNRDGFISKYPDKY